MSVFLDNAATLAWFYRHVYDAAYLRLAPRVAPPLASLKVSSMTTPLTLRQRIPRQFDAATDDRFEQ